MKASPLQRNRVPFAALRFTFVFFLSFSWLIPLQLATADTASKDERVKFNRDIRPIFSDTCFACHGFDANARKADLRLDTPGGAFAIHKGKQAIKAGDLNASEAWRRINSTDPKVVMPPPDFRKRLTPEQIALIGKWIQQGGAYEKHWAFEAPVRPEIPELKRKDWARSDLDRF